MDGVILSLRRIWRAADAASRQLWLCAQDPSGLKSFRMTPVWWIFPNEPMSPYLPPHGLTLFYSTR